ncbi:glycosyltransferase family 2 protein [Candidatus Nitrosarchaeum limnium]|nr:glycosyltransferase family A protein [Candidatus Nitrosarchaeum limnium]
MESLLLQTFDDFEIFITDNCSTDRTIKICEEFAEKDQRIKIIHHQKNIGAKRNFYSSLEVSQNKFFVWTAVDDIMEPTFLEKNIEQLKLKPDLVGSISKIEYYSLDNKNKIDFIQLDSMIGTYGEKIRAFLKKPSANLIYSVFRKDELRKSLVTESLGTWDSALVLNVLRYGDINVLDEILLKFFDEGISSTNIFNRISQPDSDMGKMTSPNTFFMKWCITHLGMKIILRNIDVFTRLNFLTFLKIVKDFVKNKINSKF